MKNLITSTSMAATLAVILLFSGCAGPRRFAQPGDHLQTDFTCRLEDGSLVETTFAALAGDDTVKKSAIFTLRDSYRPMKLTVSTTPTKIKAKPFDPLEQKISVAIARKISEIPLDKSSLLELTDSVIENFPAGDRYLKMAMEFTMPRLREMPREEFATRYNREPVTGETVGAESNYPGIIREVSDESVAIFFSAGEGAAMPTSWGGTASVMEEGDLFRARMNVKQGQLIKRIGGLPGVVSQVGDKKFTIDFGHVFAGETLYCEVAPRLYDPAKTRSLAEIDWLDDFDRGIELAAELDKHLILVLYADWCKHCHRMFDEVFPDPSLDSLRESFVWLKIDSEKMPDYAKRFGLHGYPMTVVLDSHGRKLEKLSGLQHVATLAHILKSVLDCENRS